ncbi:MAG: imelysin family protein [Myxococcota bacterium]|nr:imelysin family protein [Myxococcota bacterium]
MTVFRLRDQRAQTALIDIQPAFSRCLLCYGALALLLSGCFTDDGLSEADQGAGELAAPQSRPSVLQGLAENVYAPTFERVHQEFQALEIAVEAWDGRGEGEALIAAQAAWQSAVLSWQRAELMQVGPAGAVDRRVGGAGLREKIYSYPITNRCRVEQALAGGDFETEGWIEEAQPSIVGLDALERLLFSFDGENSCPTAARINREGLWEALFTEPGKIESQRSSYARVLAESLRGHSEALVEAWSLDQSDSFGADFGSGSGLFSDHQEVLDQVYAGLFYLDQQIKDLKLAVPAGLSLDCDLSDCPETLEFASTQLGLESLLENFVAVELIFEGAPSPESGADEGGFARLLSEAGEPALRDRIREAIQTAKAAVEAVPLSLYDGDEALEAARPALQEAHRAAQALTTLFKSQLVTVLNLSVPQEGAGDND